MKSEHLCAELHQLCRTLTRFSFPFDRDRIPANGVYLVFEKNETGHDGDRIVRIGSHTGVDQLTGRIEEHFLKENKDRSIFRKNIGRAILNKNDDDYLTKWNWDLTSRANRQKYKAMIDEKRQSEIEKEVSDYIKNRISFVVIREDDRDERLALESRLIGTVSNCNGCKPSLAWLGSYSPKRKIRESGLWQEQGLYQLSLDPDDLDGLRTRL